MSKRVRFTFFLAATSTAAGSALLGGITILTLGRLARLPTSVTIAITTSTSITTFGITISVFTLAAHLFICGGSTERRSTD